MTPSLLTRTLFIAGMAMIPAVPSANAAAAPSALPDCFDSGELLWHLKLGTHQYTIPLADRGHLYLGVNDQKFKHPAIRPSGGGVLLSVDQQTGETLWRLPVPRNMEGKTKPFHFNHWKCGVCSTPAVDDKRLYIVSPRGEVLCVDRNGQADGNDGPFLDDARYMGVPEDSGYKLTANDGDILWRYDLIKQSKVVPHDVCGSSPMVHGGFVYACTSNGIDGKHAKVANPDAPELVVLDKLTGRLAATSGALAGTKTLHGNWSSPILADGGGSPLVLFGGGDGLLYAFKPWTETGSGSKPGTLQLAWKQDCCPPDYRHRDGKPLPYSRWNRKIPDGPSEIIATPVVHDDRVYIAVGQSPLHGKGSGMLSCLDLHSGKTIWESRKVERTLSNAAIHNDLVFIPDYSGRLHCLDAGNGEHLWSHELGSGVWSASPVIVDGKVCISTEKAGFWILKASRKPELVAHCKLGSMAITPVLSDDVFYLPTQRDLFAVSLR